MKFREPREGGGFWRPFQEPVLEEEEKVRDLPFQVFLSGFFIFELGAGFEEQFVELTGFAFELSGAFEACLPHLAVAGHFVFDGQVDTRVKRMDFFWPSLRGVLQRWG